MDSSPFSHPKGKLCHCSLWLYWCLPTYRVWRTGIRSRFNPSMEAILLRMRLMVSSLQNSTSIISLMMKGASLLSSLIVAYMPRCSRSSTTWWWSRTTSSFWFARSHQLNGSTRTEEDVVMVQLFFGTGVKSVGGCSVDNQGLCLHEFKWYRILL